MGKAEVDGGAARHLVKIGEFFFGTGDGDSLVLRSHRASLHFGFFDAGAQVITNLNQPVLLGWIGSQHRTADPAFAAPCSNLTLPRNHDCCKSKRTPSNASTKHAA